MAKNYPIWFVQQFFDDNGDPLAFGKVYSYRNGTTDAIPTYNANDVANPWPLILDPSGRGVIKMDDAEVYRIETYTSLDALVKTYPGVKGNTAGVITDYLPNSGDNTYNGNLTVSGNLSATAIDAGTITVGGQDISTVFVPVENHGARTVLGNVDVATGDVSDIAIIDTAASGTTDNIPSGKALKDGLATADTFKLKVDSTDTEGFLASKLTAGAGIGLAVTGPAGTRTVTITSSTDSKVKLNAADTVPGYLDDKITAGAGISITTVGDAKVIASTSPIDGSGTADKITKWVDTDTLGSVSNISEDPSGNVVIGSNVAGTVRLNGVFKDSNDISGIPGKVLGFDASGRPIIVSANDISALSSSTGIHSFEVPWIFQTYVDKFSVGAMDGIIVNPLTGNYTSIDYAGDTDVLSPYIYTSPATYVLVDINSNLVLIDTPPTPVQRRENILLGRVVHKQGVITTIVVAPDIAVCEMSQIRDMFAPLKYINSGVSVYPNGANLLLNSTAGVFYGLGANFVQGGVGDSTGLALDSFVGGDFQHRTRNDDTTGNTNTLDVGYYDLDGTRTAIPGGGNTATNFRAFRGPSGALRLQYGQQTYATLADAVTASVTESYVYDPTLKANLQLIGIISVRKGATNLSLATDAKFTPASMFGEIVGGGGGTPATLQQTYDNSITPEIVTDATRGALSLKRGSAADTDIVFEVQNGAGTNTLTVTGAGTTTTSGDVWINKVTDAYLTVGATDGTKSTVMIQGAAATERRLLLGTGTNARWSLIATNAAETGSAAGSNFELRAYTDAGALLDTPITLYRATGGGMYVSRPVDLQQGLTLSKVSNPVLQVGGNTSTSPSLYINGGAGTNRGFRYLTAGLTRWLLQANSGAESGSNAGSNLDILSYDDAGAFIDAPISIIRAITGVITMARDLVVSKVTTPAITIGGNSSTNSRTILNGIAGSQKTHIYKTAGVDRWALGSNSTAEAGSDAGSNLDVTSYTDAGVVIDTPLSITRAAAGVVSIRRNVVLTGGINSNTTNGGIFGNTNDAADNYTVTVSSTTGQSSTRGGYVVVKGNEVATNGGDVLIEAGNSATGTGDVKLLTGGLEKLKISKTGLIDFTIPAGQGINATVPNATDLTWNAVVSGDLYGRTTVYPGKIEFGAGGSTLRDTNLYRSGADTLKTDDSFIVGAGLYTVGNIYMNPATRMVVNTTDGADTSYLEINGGGGSGNGRGASVVAYGNEATTVGGNLYLNTGNGVDGSIILSTGPSLTQRMRVSPTGSLHVAGTVFMPSAGTIALDNSPDGGDSSYLNIAGGGSASNTRGGYIQVIGNEFAGAGGSIALIAGDATSVQGDIVLYTGAATERLRITKAGAIIAPAINNMEGISARSGNSVNNWADLGDFTVPVGSTCSLNVTVNIEFDSYSGRAIINLSNNAGVPVASISDVVAYGTSPDFALPIGDGFGYTYVGNVITIWAKHKPYGGGGRVVETKVIAKSASVTPAVVSAPTWTTSNPSASMMAVTAYTNINDGVIVFATPYITSAGGTITGEVTFASGLVSSMLVKATDSIGFLSETITGNQTSIVYDTYQVLSTDELTVNGTLVLL